LENIEAICSPFLINCNPHTHLVTIYLTMNNWKAWLESLKAKPYSALGLLILLALPVTLMLVFRSQDTRSKASAPDKLEVEAGTLNSNAQTVADSTASGGNYVRLDSVSAPSPTTLPSTGTGTGGTYKPSYVTVTGGGSMPSTTGGISVADYGAKGDGVNDDTAEIQAAANAARTAGKPLLIPKTSSFYKVLGTITIYGSVIGVNGMPTIKQSSGDHGWNGATFDIADNATGWIYNLHLIGDYNGQYFNYRSNPPTYPNPVYPDGEGAALIRLRGVNGLTIKGNIFENPWGDGIFDGGSSESYPARNVLIDNNTFKNAMRCEIALTRHINSMAIMNNKIIHASYYVNPIDLEPDYGQAPYEFLDGWIVNVEIGRNEYQITSSYAVNELTGWFDPTPGGNIWLHDNFGSWIGPFYETLGLKGAPSTWINVNVSNNVETP
jgi:hypothetical protein